MFCRIQKLLLFISPKIVEPCFVRYRSYFARAPHLDSSALASARILWWILVGLGEKWFWCKMNGRDRFFELTSRNVRASLVELHQILNLYWSWFSAERSDSLVESHYLWFSKTNFMNKIDLIWEVNQEKLLFQLPVPYNLFQRITSDSA